MRTRTGQAPQVLASENNLVLDLLGRQDMTNVTKAQRAIADHLNRFLQQLVLRVADPAA